MTLALAAGDLSRILDDAGPDANLDEIMLGQLAELMIADHARVTADEELARQLNYPPVGIAIVRVIAETQEYLHQERPLDQPLTRAEYRDYAVAAYRAVVETFSL